MALYQSLPELQQQFDAYDSNDLMLNNWFWRAASRFVRAESMNVSNDPRFFCDNVMEHRLSAFQVLSIVNSLMFGTALHQSFALKKDMNFAKVSPYVGNVAIWQIISFCVAAAVAIMCLLSLYILAHQLFLMYRLMTAGPSGLDQAAIFYLTKTITMWRHLSIKFLFNGLLMFLLLVSMQLFVRFYHDADTQKESFDEVWIVNMDRGTSVEKKLIHTTEVHELSMGVHVCIGYVVLSVSLVVASLMIWIRRQHLAVFGENFAYCQSKTHSVTKALRHMSSRSGPDIET